MIVVLPIVFAAVLVVEFAIALALDARFGPGNPVSPGMLVVVALIFTMAFGAALLEFAPGLFED